MLLKTLEWQGWWEALAKTAVARRIASFAADTVRTLNCVAVDGRNGTALQTLRISGEWWRRIGNRRIVAPVRDREIEGWLLVHEVLLVLLMLLMRLVRLLLLLLLLLRLNGRATHTAFDLYRSQWRSQHR